MSAKFSVVYYSDGRNPEAVRAMCLTQLREAVEDIGGEIVMVDHAPTGPRSHKDLYARILAGLDRARCEIVFMAEDDVLYPVDHFMGLLDAAAKKIVRNPKVINLTRKGFIYTGPGIYMSAYAGPRDLWRLAVQGKVSELERCGRVVWTEPSSDPVECDGTAVIDVRHECNFTGTRDGEGVGKVFGWPHAAVLLRGMKLPCDISEGESVMGKLGIIDAPAIENPKVYVAVCCAAPGKVYCRVNGKWIAISAATFGCPHCKKTCGTVTGRIAKHCEACGKRLEEAPTAEYVWGLDDGFDAHLRAVVTEHG